MIGIGHLDIMPLIYGIIMFLGLWSKWHKVTFMNHSYALLSRTSLDRVIQNICITDF